MATSINQSDFVKTALRLPPELHAAVHTSAQQAGRSYNAQLVYLIEKALTAPANYIPAPGRVMTFGKDGSPTEFNARELMADLADMLRRASNVAEMFRAWEDGDPQLADISNPPDFETTRALNSAPRRPRAAVQSERQPRRAPIKPKQ